MQGYRCAKRKQKKVTKAPFFVREGWGLLVWRDGYTLDLRDIKLCAQKVEPCEWLAVRYRGPRSLSDALAGRTVGKNSGQLELALTDWR
jgi:hypothetical protein